MNSCLEQLPGPWCRYQKASAGSPQGVRGWLSARHNGWSVRTEKEVKVRTEAHRNTVGATGRTRRGGGKRRRKERWPGPQSPTAWSSTTEPNSWLHDGVGPHGWTWRLAFPFSPFYSCQPNLKQKPFPIHPAHLSAACREGISLHAEHPPVAEVSLFLLSGIGATVTSGRHSTATGIQDLPSMVPAVSVKLNTTVFILFFTGLSYCMSWSQDGD